jgi:hypothetical protein
MLRLVRDTDTVDDDGLDLPDAFTSLAEIADGETNWSGGPEASLIYVEGDLALYLDEHDTAEALRDVTDRDLVILESLVTLGANRIAAELGRRIREEA